MENEFTQNTTTAPVNLTDEDTTQAKKLFSKLGLMFLIGTLIINAVQLIASAIAGAINPDLLMNTSYALLIIMIPMYVIAMPITGLLISRVPANKIPQKKISIGQFIIAFLMCYGAMYLSNLIGVFLTTIIGAIKGGTVENTIVNIASSSSIPVNFFIMVICAPIAEELLFRKLLIDRTYKYSEGISIFLSGLMFGLFHGNLNQFVYAFVIGAFWAFIYIKTGKIAYSIALHMIINFMGSVLGMIVLKFAGDGFVEAMNDPTLLMPYVMENLVGVVVYLVYAFAIMLIAISGIILLIVNRKKMQLTSNATDLPKEKRFSTVYLNLGMGLYCIFWIVMIVIQLFA